MNAAPSLDFSQIPMFEGYVRSMAVDVDVHVEELADGARDGFTPEQLGLLNEILSATDREDLAELVEYATVDPRLMKATRTAGPPDPSRTGDNVFVDLDRLTYVFGEVAAKPIIETGKLVAGIAKVVVDVLSKHPTPLTHAKRTPADVIYDPTLPLSFRKAAEGAMRTVAVMFAITFAVHKGAKLSPWLASGLANEFSAPIIALVEANQQSPITERLKADHARAEEMKVTLDRLFATPEP